jgi:GNAT superfamily N-acetyltransferase
MLTLSTSSAVAQFRSRVTKADADAVEHLVRQSSVFNAAEIAIARELVEEHLEKGAVASGYHFLFADGPSGLEGYVCFGPIPATAARFELYWIAVDPNLSRAGLGRRLQRAAEDAARSLGATWLMAETSTRADYETARAFYRALGYRHLGDVPDWYADDDGLCVFGMKL